MHTNQDAFAPDWASAPGDTIRDALREKGVSSSQLASKLSMSAERFAQLLNGQCEINLDLAHRLEKHLGGSVEFWIRREQTYQASLARIQAINTAWLDELPLKYLAAQNWVSQELAREDKAKVCAAFFGQPSIEACRRQYAAFPAMAYFRATHAYDSVDASIACWLRRGEQIAARLQCAPWNTARFMEALQKCRGISRLKTPKQFVPLLRQACADSGVALALVPAPPKCRASGATFFLSNRRAVILMSGRYKSDDQFWFTFFHEAGHLVLHSGGQIFLEGCVSDNAQETEANRFAQDVLIPVQHRDEFNSLPFEHEAVIRYARKIGIAPGIVVGQLQHSRGLPHGWLERLKRRFDDTLFDQD